VAPPSPGRLRAADGRRRVTGPRSETAGTGNKSAPGLRAVSDDVEVPEVVALVTAEGVRVGARTSCTPDVNAGAGAFDTVGAGFGCVLASDVAATEGAGVGAATGAGAGGLGIF